MKSRYLLYLERLFGNMWTAPQKDTQYELAKFLGLHFSKNLAKVYSKSHSSAIALREHFSPEQIKQGTMHQTNKAFERYFRIGAEIFVKFTKKH